MGKIDKCDTVRGSNVIVPCFCYSDMDPGWVWRQCWVSDPSRTQRGQAGPSSPCMRQSPPYYTSEWLPQHARGQGSAEGLSSSSALSLTAWARRVSDVTSVQKWGPAGRGAERDESGAGPGEKRHKEPKTFTNEGRANEQGKERDLPTAATYYSLSLSPAPRVEQTQWILGAAQHVRTTPSKK